jgi:hypothetical protein
VIRDRVPRVTRGGAAAARGTGAGGRASTANAALRTTDDADLRTLLITGARGTREGTWVGLVRVANIVQ